MRSLLNPRALRFLGFNKFAQLIVLQALRDNEEANREVQITVEEVPPAPMSQEEWQQLVLSTGGKWQGEFQRPEQGDYERREPLS
jgi:hypothetical protein